MTPRRRMIVAWALILAGVIGFCALYGGRNCEAPSSGPLHFLASHKYVASRSWRSGGCVEVSRDGTPFPLAARH